MARKGGGRFSGYDPALENAVFEFQKSTYPERNQETIADQWRWMLVESAQRLQAPPSVWLYLKDDAVLAHQGAIPIDLHTEGERLRTGWFVETMAASGIRGSAIGPMVIKKALEDMNLSLSLGQNEQMRQIQFALGWEQICALTKYVFVCGYGMNLRGKLPPGLAEVAAFSLGVAGRRKTRRAESTARGSYSSHHVHRFGEAHDALWERMAASCSCAAKRDASYLNWKYFDRPAARFEAIEVRDDDRVVGTVVTKLESPSDVYPYRRGVLVDFVVPLDDAAAQIALLAYSIRHLEQAGAQTVICQISNPALERTLTQFGFRPRGEGHQFLIYALGVDEGVATSLRSPENWLLTLGDSDADNYPD
ncbi:MAG: hypothetical protein AAFZ58_01550 [Pseudomonadota bacterium]